MIDLNIYLNYESGEYTLSENTLTGAVSTNTIKQALVDVASAVDDNVVIVIGSTNPYTSNYFTIVQDGAFTATEWLLINKTRKKIIWSQGQ